MNFDPRNDDPDQVPLHMAEVDTNWGQNNRGEPMVAQLEQLLAARDLAGSEHLYREPSHVMFDEEAFIVDELRPRIADALDTIRGFRLTLRVARDLQTVHDLGLSEPWRAWEAARDEWIDLHRICDLARMVGAMPASAWDPQAGRVTGGFFPALHRFEFPQRGLFERTRSSRWSLLDPIVDEWNPGIYTAAEVVAFQRNNLAAYSQAPANGAGVNAGRFAPGDDAA